MQAKLIYSIPEQEADLLNALNGAKYKSVLQKFDNQLIASIVHFTGEDESAVVQNLIDLRQTLSYLCDEQQISIY